MPGIFRILALVATLCLQGAVTASAATVTVFAAASLSESLRAIAAEYEKASGDKILFNFAASSLLARQIEAGAPADIFFSADEARMDALEGAGLILKTTRQSRLSNTLVIVVASERGAPVTRPEDLAGPGVKRLALAETRTVPAGIYARQYLEKQNLWERVERRVVPTGNVRAALAAVEAGNADAAIVYKTDAGISRKVKVAFEVPPPDNPAISYPMAVVKGSKNVEAAKRFLAHLGSGEAARVFERFGFIVRNPER